MRGVCFCLASLRDPRVASESYCEAHGALFERRPRLRIRQVLPKLTIHLK